MSGRVSGDDWRWRRGSLPAVLAGGTIGTLVGVLPGLSVAAMVALMLPFASTLGAVPALVMLAAVYFGAQYGGSTAAILASEPGEASAGATALDGHHLARQGRAGPALATAALASFFAGCAGALVIAVDRAADHRARLPLRPFGIRLADGARPRRRGGAGAGLPSSRPSG